MTARKVTRPSRRRGRGLGYPARLKVLESLAGLDREGIRMTVDHFAPKLAQARSARKARNVIHFEGFPFFSTSTSVFPL